MVRGSSDHRPGGLQKEPFRPGAENCTCQSFGRGLRTRRFFSSSSSPHPPGAFPGRRDNTQSHASTGPKVPHLPVYGPGPSILRFLSSPSDHRRLSLGDEGTHKRMHVPSFCIWAFFRVVARGPSDHHLPPGHFDLFFSSGALWPPLPGGPFLSLCS